MENSPVHETENSSDSEMENSPVREMENSVLKCELCSHKFSSKQEWKMHMSAEHDTTVHICDLCPEVYYSEAGYLQHFDEVHKSEFNRHTCSFCGVSYKWFKYLEKHIQRKHLVNNLKQCAKCGEEFYNTLAYMRHLKLKHAPGRAFYKCDKCFRSFTAKSYVDLHERFDHNPEGLKYFQEYAFESLNLESEELLEDLTKCCKCNLEFSSAMYLYKHLQLVHNQKKFYQCCVCQDAVYGNRSGLTIHLFHEHNISREHKCSKCSTALFQSPSNKRVKNEAVKPLIRKKKWEKPSEDAPSWSRLFIKQGIPEDVELTNANETEISNLRNNIKNLFHILSTVPPSKLKGTMPTDLHVESVFSIKKMKRDDRRRHQIVANPEDDVENEIFPSNAVQNENRRLRKKKRNTDKIDGVSTVVRGKDGNQKYQCDICHHAFSYRKGLKAHVIFRHGYNGQFNFKRPKTEVLSTKIIENSCTDFDTTLDNNSDLSLSEIMNDSNYVWNDLTSPDRETNEITEAMQIDDNSDTSQKENKCDELDDDSDTSTNVNISKITQKVNTSNTTPRGTKSMNTPKFNKLNAPQKFKETKTTPKVKKTEETPKVNKFNTLEIVNESITTHKVTNQEKNPKVNKSHTLEKASKSDTTPKTTETKKSSKYNKPKTPEKVNESNTTSKFAQPEQNLKVNKPNIEKVNVGNTTPKEAKPDKTPKDKKSSTPKTVSESNRASKSNQSNETSKLIEINKRKKPNETVLSSEDNSCTPKKVKKYDATLKENKSGSPSVLKFFKIPKVTPPQIEKSSATPKAIQTETAEAYIEKDPKINKLNTQQKEGKSATANKDNSFTPHKPKNTVVSQKERKSETPTKVTLANGSKTGSKLTGSNETPKVIKLKKNRTVILPEDNNSCTQKMVKKNDTTVKRNESDSLSMLKSYTIPKVTKVNPPQLENSNVTPKSSPTETTKVYIEKDPKIDKFNTQQEDNKSVTSNNSPQSKNTAQSNVTPKSSVQKSFNIPKVTKVNSTQMEKSNLNPKTIQTETSQVYIGKDSEINKLNTQQECDNSSTSNDSLSVKKSFEIPKDTEDNSLQIEKSNVTAKATQTERSAVNIEKDPKINTQHEEDGSTTSNNDNSCSLQKDKTDTSLKGSKLKTPTQTTLVNVSNTASKVIQSNETPKLNKKSVKILRVVKVNTPQINKSIVTPKVTQHEMPEFYIETQPKINEQHNRQHLSATSIKDNFCTTQKAKSSESELDIPTKVTSKISESDTSHETVQISNVTQMEFFPTQMSPEVSTTAIITPQTVTIATYKCKFCQIQFEDQLLLLNHLTESHSDTAAKDGETIFKCIDCGIAFQHKDSLDTHLKESHDNDNISLYKGPNACLLCNRIFKNKRGLKVHNLRTHDVKNEYACKKCNFKSNNKRKFTNHPCVKEKTSIEVEYNEENIVEEKDNSRLQEVEYEKIKDELMKMCKKEMKLKNFQQEKSTKIHKCLKCEKKFPKRTFLLSHIKNDHKINLFKLHKCDMCNSVFKMADKLTQHIKLKHKTLQQKNHLPVIKINKSKLSPLKFASGGMPNILSNILYLNSQMHTCGICNSYFSTNELLERHIQWEHTKNVNLHKCGQCSQVLYNVEDLEMHMSNAHNTTDGIFKWKKQIAYNYEQQTDF